MNDLQEQEFWDERFRFAQRERGLRAIDAGEFADAAMEIRRGQPLIRPEDLESARNIADAWCARYQALYEEEAEARKKLAIAEGQVNSLKDANAKLECKVSYFATKCESLKQALVVSAQKVRAFEAGVPPLPREQLTATVTVGDIARIMKAGPTVWVGIRNLLALWGVDVAALDDAEFWSDETGIEQLTDIWGNGATGDYDRRLRLRAYLQRGVFVSPTA